MIQIPKLKKDFIEFIIRKSVIKFGEYTTKSGRITPYFLNLGDISNGHDIRILAEMYADVIMKNYSDDFDNLFGPAYKGIPLVVSTATALDMKYQKCPTFTYNRKEPKDHGERGILVGHQYQPGDRVIVLEDVITAGTSIYETVRLLESNADIKLKALVVAVDRQERGHTGQSALSEICDKFNIRATSIASIDEIVNYAKMLEIDGKPYLSDKDMERIEEYRRNYGA